MASSSGTGHDGWPPSAEEMERLNLEQRKAEGREPGLPVAAPDRSPHSDGELTKPELLSDERLGEIVAQCLRKLDALPTIPGTLRMYRNGITALWQLQRRLSERDALLAERQQDKERIERLEKALREIAKHRPFTSIDSAQHARAALAVEEDAP